MRVTTWRHHRSGSLRWDLIGQLAPAIAMGAIVGAYAALQLDGTWLRWLFIGYLVLTLLDGWLRPGFVSVAGAVLRPMSRAGSALAHRRQPARQSLPGAARHSPAGDALRRALSAGQSPCNGGNVRV
ncbi:sulfite exporter TauE/SafE family protein [Pseudomonas urmiensis]|uniref:Probable membrane transporter protein n=1 Tax=Pseudomonas urmiensis TaxID=2745493 RepID=A0ABW8NVW0_9PSED